MNFVLRPAVAADADRLATFENSVFTGDRISRRSFRYLLSRPTAATTIAESAGRILGYSMILFRAGTGLARLYSIAVDPAARATGIGTALLQAAEQDAYSHDRIVLRLEVRSDNAEAIAFYRRRGYRQIGSWPDYYEDQGDALRFEKILKGDSPASSPVPYYEQTEDFTCGAACLLMALSAFDPDTEISAVEEIRLWREATTVFMQSGPGGCEPFGIAVTAVERGLRARILSSQPGPLFLDTVRSAEKRRVMRLAQTGFRQRAESLGINADIREFALDELRNELAKGSLIVALVSGYRMFDRKVPHWILVHGDDGQHMLIHDPWVEKDRDETGIDAANLPIPYAVFDRMARFGKNGLRAAVILRKARS